MLEGILIKATKKYLYFARGKRMAIVKAARSGPPKKPTKTEAKFLPK